MAACQSPHCQLGHGSSLSRRDPVDLTTSILNLDGVTQSEFPAANMWHIGPKKEQLRARLFSTCFVIFNIFIFAVLYDMLFLLDVIAFCFLFCFESFCVGVCLNVSSKICIVCQMRCLLVSSHHCQHNRHKMYLFFFFIYTVHFVHDHCHDLDDPPCVHHHYRRSYHDDNHEVSNRQQPSSSPTTISSSSYDRQIQTMTSSYIFLIHHLSSNIRGTLHTPTRLRNGACKCSSGSRWAQSLFFFTGTFCLVFIRLLI